MFQPLLFNHLILAILMQGVKKKAQELERKTREAEKERRELEKELERLHRVKKMGDVAASDVPQIR